MPAVQTPFPFRLPGTRSVLVVGTLGLWLAACATAPLETTAAGTAPVAPAEPVSVPQAPAEPASAPVADTSASEGRVVDEQRYRVDLGDQPAGELVLRETRDGETLVSETTMRLSVRRGASEVAIEMASRFEEGLDGTPRRAWTRQLLGPSPVETEYVFTASEILVTSRHGGEESQERQRLPEIEWLTPGQTQQAIGEHLAAGVEEFRIRTIDPLMGLAPVEVDWKLQTRDSEVALGDGMVATSRWHQVQSINPQLVNVVELDADGRMIRSETPILGMTMRVTLLPEGEKVAPGRAPEILVSTFLEPDRPIPRPRRLRRAVYDLRLADGSELEELPSAGAQRFERRGAGGRIEVDLDRVSVVTSDEDAAEYLQASTYVDHDHPEVITLAQTALADLDSRGNDRKRAETLRRFVGRHLESKDLETALATAGEAALARSGDCTEHSVLLAALLRSVDIPSRVASGVVYLEQFLGQRNIFGYHMWTQALVDGRWIDLDATLPGPFDATHIAFAVTGLNDDQQALVELGRLAPLIGRLELKVVELGAAVAAPVATGAEEN